MLKVFFQEKSDIFMADISKTLRPTLKQSTDKRENMHFWCESELSF